MKDNQNQHYVPQYYLKNFSKDGHIHVYDLKDKKPFTNSISNVAFKKHFYNVDTNFFNKIIENEAFEEEDFIDKLINKHYESILAAFFDSFNPTRERIINNDNRKTISVIDFHSLVDFVLVQTYKNPKLQLFFEMMQEQINKNKEIGYIKLDKIGRGIVILLVLNELHYGRKTQIKKEIVEVFNPIIEEIKTWKELVTNSYKYVYWNLTDIDFLTSDFGMSFMRLSPEDNFTTIFIPINTKIGVLLVNKKSSIWNNRITNSSSILKIDNSEKRQIEVFNQAIIENANRFVFSLNGQFPEDIKSVTYKEWWNRK
ncbi:DUF4238 domain-containing protein [Runella sp.]|jgi:hypothetical protein|uniref:DUF4238 domain-containing protein n=1 Tax=Runella sp. TaxID=1960881 RepID=UPI002607BC50|nr:DUF4238 domain-containing protein [Runella sp.]